MQIFSYDVSIAAPIWLILDQFHAVLNNVRQDNRRKPEKDAIFVLAETSRLIWFELFWSK